MGIGKFFFSREFLKQLLLIIGALLLTLILILLSLRFYTHHGQSIAVPDLTGLTEDRAHDKLSDCHLRIKLIDSIYVDNALPGTVVDQYPKPGYRAKHRRKIYVTIASVTPEKVMVPCVTDVSFREASGRLQNAGLKLGTVEQRPSAFPNLVLDQLYLGQRITRDTLLPRGSVIDLVIGRGGNFERTEVPDLFGLSIGEARKRLYALNLELGAVVFDDSFLDSEDTLGARIYKQSPKPVSGEMVEQGTLIDIRVSKYDELFKLNSEEGLEDADSTGGL